MGVRELFRRNVRWVQQDLWADPEIPAEDTRREEQVEATFDASQFGMKLTVFQSYYILRTVEHGLDSIEALEAHRGKPALEILKAFQTDCSEILEMGSYLEF